MHKYKVVLVLIMCSYRFHCLHCIPLVERHQLLLSLSHLHGVSYCCTWPLRWARKGVTATRLEAWAFSSFNRAGTRDPVHALRGHSTR